MYHTENERIEAHKQSIQRAENKRKKYLQSLSDFERKKYYRKNYEQTERKRISREKHIKSCIEFLNSLGYEVV